MDNNTEQVARRKKMTKRWGVISLAISLVVIGIFIIGNEQARASHATQSGLIVIFIIIGLISFVSILVFLSYLIAFFMAKFHIGKETFQKTSEVLRDNRLFYKKYLKLIYSAAAIMAVVFIAFFINHLPKHCKDAECFVTAANISNCRTVDLELTDKAGTLWRYRIDKSEFGYCLFTKTLIRLDSNEGQPMKELLEGTGLICEKASTGRWGWAEGHFDSRLITSPILGIENCHGELKEKLGQLLFLL